MTFSPAYQELFARTQDRLEKEAGLFGPGALLGPSVGDYKALSRLSHSMVPGASHIPELEQKVLASRSLGTKVRESLVGHDPNSAVTGYLSKENRRLRKLNKQLEKNPLGAEAGIAQVAKPLAAGTALGAGGLMGYNTLKNQTKSDSPAASDTGLTPEEITALKAYYGIG